MFTPPTKQASTASGNVSQPAPSMNWQKLLSPTRLGRKKDTSEMARSPYHKDYDRIIFSHSFRQLNRKTQVHPLTDQAGIHTRLTHSLEVSCVGRSLGMMAAEKISDELPPEINSADIGVIVQAACLAHDIGNPPFGHAGEYAIRDWFKQPKQTAILAHLTDAERNDMLQFEGNAQGFRILTRNEYHPNAGGMRLTSATLGAFLKYPWLARAVPTQSSSKPIHTKYKKFGCYQSEKDILIHTASELGLVATDNLSFCRHPLAYLLEAADDICYALIDLEDGIHLGMVNYQEVEPLMLAMIGDELGTPPELSDSTASMSQKLAALRGRAMKRLVDEASSVFAQKQPELLAGTAINSLLTHAPKVLSDGIATAKNMARTQIFNHPQKARLELVACACLHTLLDNFIPLAIPAAHNSFKELRLLTLLTQQRIELTEDIYTNLLCILDYIASLTDNQALALAQELQGTPSLSF